MYFFADLYPNLGVNTTRSNTVPEREEQKHYYESGENPVAVTAGVKQNIWVGLIALLIVLVMANIT